MESIQSIITTIILSSSQQNELFAALAKAQGSFEIARKDALNPHFKSKFASYTDLVAATRPALSANGLSVNHKTITDIDGKQYMITKLMHSSGQFDASLVPLRPDKKIDVQGYGSERSYQMRYSYKELVGVCANDGEDDDGESAVGRGYNPAPVSRNFGEQGSNTINDRHTANTITLEQSESLNMALDDLANEESLRMSILKNNKVESLDKLPVDKFNSVLKFILDNALTKE